MAKKVSFGLTLPNRGVVLGITTVKEMLELSVEAEKSGVFDSIWAGDSIAAKPHLPLFSCAESDLAAQPVSRRDCTSISVESDLTGCE